MTMLPVSRHLSDPHRARRAELLAMAGTSESVLMAKVRSQHLLPFAQENSRSSEWLPRPPGEYVWRPRILAAAERLGGCSPLFGRAQFDVEDIQSEFDIYKRARESMELNHRLYPVRAGSWTIFPGQSFGKLCTNKLKKVVED